MVGLRSGARPPRARRAGAHGPRADKRCRCRAWAAPSGLVGCLCARAAAIFLTTVSADSRGASSTLKAFSAHGIKQCGAKPAVDRACDDLGERSQSLPKVRDRLRPRDDA